MVQSINFVILQEHPTTDSKPLNEKNDEQIKRTGVSNVQTKGKGKKNPPNTQQKGKGKKAPPMHNKMERKKNPLIHNKWKKKKEKKYPQHNKN